MCVPKKNFFVWRIFFSTKYDDEWLCIEVMTNEAFLTMNEDMTTVDVFPFKIEYNFSTNNCKGFFIIQFILSMNMELIWHNERPYKK